MASDTKYCKSCRKTLPATSFSEGRAICNSCRTNRNNEAISASPQAFLRRMFTEVKSRSKRRGYKDFDLTIEDVYTLWDNQKGRCALSGLPLTHHYDKGASKEFNASLDRIRSTEGYKIGNVQLVANRVNLMKGPMDEATLYWWVTVLHKSLVEDRT